MYEADSPESTDVVGCSALDIDGVDAGATGDNKGQKAAGQAARMRWVERVALDASADDIQASVEDWRKKVEKEKKERESGVRMTFRKITEVCLDKAFQKNNNSDAVAEKLLAVTVARLDWQNLSSIECLEPLTNIEDLYLQHNRISKIENLDFHYRLRFLALGNNHITRIEGLKHLPMLALLDLSNNRIEELDEEELPTSLRNLDLSGNPCDALADYRERIVSQLPELTILDGRRVHEQEGDDEDEEGKEGTEEKSRSEEHYAMQEQEEKQHIEGQAGEEPRQGELQHELLDRSLRSSKRPMSAVSRSDAMMEAAIQKIESMQLNAAAATRSILREGRREIADRSRARMEEQEASFNSRMRPTVVPT